MYLVTLKRDPDWAEIVRLTDNLDSLDVLTLVVEREPCLVAKIDKIRDLIFVLGEVPSANV